MSTLTIDREKVCNFNQLDFTENRTICQQNGENGTSIKLTLSRRMYKGKHSILLTGFAYNNGEFIKCSNLGNFTPGEEGPEMVLGACDCYSYSGMYELIIH